MADTYAILGFASDLYKPVVLYTSDSATQANGCRNGYTLWGDWGGYDCLALYEVGPCESPDTIHLYDMPIDTIEKEES